MITKKREIGNFGEDCAVKYLRRKHYRILARNYVAGKLELDVIARKKREIVLGEIAKQFEKNKKYAEKEVNDIIHRFHEDHCTIRREMIACGIMAREKEIYWLI